MSLYDYRHRRRRCYCCHCRRRCSYNFQNISWFLQFARKGYARSFLSLVSGCRQCNKQTVINISIVRSLSILYFSLRMSVCQRSRTAGRNSCSIVSANVSNYSYRLTVNPVTSSRLSSAQQFLYTRTSSKTSGRQFVG